MSISFWPDEKLQYRVRFDSLKRRKQEDEERQRRRPSSDVSFRLHTFDETTTLCTFDTWTTPTTFPLLNKRGRPPEFINELLQFSTVFCAILCLLDFHWTVCKTSGKQIEKFHPTAEWAKNSSTPLLFRFQNETARGKGGNKKHHGGLQLYTKRLHEMRKFWGAERDCHVHPIRA